MVDLGEYKFGILGHLILGQVDSKGSKEVLWNYKYANKVETKSH